MRGTDVAVDAIGTSAVPRVDVFVWRDSAEQAWEVEDEAVSLRFAAGVLVQATRLLLSDRRGGDFAQEPLRGSVSECAVAIPHPLSCPNSEALATGPQARCYT
jgi:hypothetical protein